MWGREDRRGGEEVSSKRTRPVWSGQVFSVSEGVGMKKNWLKMFPMMAYNYRSNGSSL